MSPDNRKWKILSSEYLVRRPWLTVRRDKVELPDGRVNPEFYVLEYPAWVNVIAITDDGRIIMERQYRHALGETSFEIPAGVAEEGETPLEAAQRELEEETGYVGGEWTQIVEISANPGLMDNLTHCFLAKGVKPEGKRHLDDTEDLEVVLMERDEVVRLLQTDQLRQALMIAPLYKALYNNLI